MIEIVKGNLFNSKAQTLVNTVNCVGVMGKGIALEFKKRYPDVFHEYKILCDKKELVLGKPKLIKNLLPPWVLLFPTKNHWRSSSKISDIEDGLIYLEKHYKEWGITSIAVPPLGCGLGNLNWKDVKPLMLSYFSHFDIPVEIYEPLKSIKKKVKNLK